MLRVSTNTKGAIAVTGLNGLTSGRLLNIAVTRK